MRSSSTLLASAALFSALGASAFDITRNDNAVAYWGQNSYGAANPSDTANYQQNLSFYCQDDSIDVFAVSFLTVFFGTGGLPEMDLANICSVNTQTPFPGSQLPDCSFMADDIKTCQAKGKIVTLSMGGATGGNAFTSDSQAQAFADQIWELFLGGSSQTRPFGDAVLDGVDLDIEGGSSAGYAAFVTQMRTHYTSATDKTYYVTGAPQCVFPDAYLGDALNNAYFDAVYVQFYNNFCGVNNFNNPNAWDFGQWDNWAKTQSPNKNVKVFLGVPASTSAANAGSYVDPGTLAGIISSTRSQYSSFGGVMYWDASQAYANNRFDQAIKSALGGGSSVPPSSSAPAPPSSSAPAPPSSSAAPPPPPTTPVAPTTTSSVAPPPPSTTPSPTGTGGGGGEDPCSTDTPSTTPSPTTSSAPPPPPPPPSTTSDPCATNTPTPPPPPPPSTTSDPCGTPTPSSAPGGGSASSCSAAPWSASQVYTGGQTASYNGHGYTALWWTQGETPGVAQVWTDNGACGGASRRSGVGLQRRHAPDAKGRYHGITRRAFAPDAAGVFH